MAITGEVSTFVTNTIYAWLHETTFETSEVSSEMTETLLTEILLAMGHREPFDEEQRAIIDMLRLKKANKQCCIAVWEFYNQYYGYDVCLKDLKVAA